MTSTDKFNIRNTLCCHLTETWYFRSTFKQEHTLLPETQYFRNKFKQEHTLLPETHSNLNKEICKAKRRKISYKWHCLIVKHSSEIDFLVNVRKFRLIQYMSNRCWLARWWFSWGAPKLWDTPLPRDAISHLDINNLFSETPDLMWLAGTSILPSCHQGTVVPQY